MLVVGVVWEGFRRAFFSYLPALSVLTLTAYIVKATISAVEAMKIGWHLLVFVDEEVTIFVVRVGQSVYRYDRYDRCTLFDCCCSLRWVLWYMF